MLQRLNAGSQQQLVACQKGSGAVEYMGCMSPNLAKHTLLSAVPHIRGLCPPHGQCAQTPPGAGVPGGDSGVPEEVRRDGGVPDILLHQQVRMGGSAAPLGSAFSNFKALWGLQQHLEQAQDGEEKQLSGRARRSAAAGWQQTTMRQVRRCANGLCRRCSHPGHARMRAAGQAAGGSHCVSSGAATCWRRWRRWTRRTTSTRCAAAGSLG